MIPRDWTATFYTCGSAACAKPLLNCTATLIGRQGLLTAAHCIGKGKSVTIQAGGTAYSGKCESPDAYPADPSADWALCLMPTTIPVKTYESVSLDISRLAMDQLLTLTGYGCQMIGGKTRGTFLSGPSWIQSMLGEVWDMTVTPSRLSQNWITTYPASTRGGAFICPGDSGGAVYRMDAAAALSWR